MDGIGLKMEVYFMMGNKLNTIQPLIKIVT